MGRMNKEKKKIIDREKSSDDDEDGRVEIAPKTVLCLCACVLVYAVRVCVWHYARSKVALSPALVLVAARVSITIYTWI